ncbi:MAG: hypothetical protein IK025_02375 [Bacteroidales bacterium]|nr:hypothetical protein [Bacteroidales bacterium]
MKIVKKTWISILALATAIVAACTATKRTSESAETAPQPADNDNLGENDEMYVPKDSINARRAELQARLESLRATIKDRETSCVYGSPEVMREYSARTRAMRHEADSLQNELLKMLESEKSSLKERLDAIDETVNARSGAKVYGPPEMINKYNNRTKNLRESRDSLQNEIDKIDREIYNINNSSKQ